MLNTGEKSIIFLLNYNKSEMSKLRLIKLMFLISKRVPIYDFVPYRYGPFSFILYHDLFKLEKEGYISVSDEAICLIKKDMPIIDNRKKNVIRMYSQNFSSMDDKSLLEYVYDKYPQYTVFSLYSKNCNYEKGFPGITTIGYEGKSLDKFLSELIKNKIEILVDIRRNPYSRKFGFQGYKLNEYLGKINICYRHIPQLGIASDLRKNLKKYEDYVILFEKYKDDLKENEEFIEELKSIGKDHRISLMCYEKNIRYCHRGILAEVLRADGIEVTDI
jgi:uncharacterized protein (DUF488 family)